ncbi:MAG: TolC family outer membrane protein [Deltaproteobacteria bacterium]|jgi:outer membrane protein|nr:TolC family outer membrane protein [Deltaproteobacteria bacterium]
MQLHGSPALSSLCLKLTIVVVLVFTATAARAYDLQTAYRQAMATSPAIVRARAQLDAELEGRPLARAALLPHLGGFASGGMNSARVTGLGPIPISTGYHSDVLSATLTQSIFDGQAWESLKQADSRIRAGEAALASTEQSLMFDVTQAYFEVLQTQADERVARQQVKLLQAIADQTKTSLRVGKGDIISVQEAQAQLDAAKTDLVVAKNRVAISKAQLEQLTHHRPGALQDVKVLHVIGPQPDSLTPWIESALKNQPLLQQARASLETSKEQVEYEKRARWPTLTLNGFVEHAAGTLIPPLTMNQAGAVVSVSIPFFEGGAIRARVRQAEALSHASGAKVLALKDQIRLDTQAAFLTLQDSVARFDATQASVASARLSMEGTRKGYEIGTRSLVDLLTATTNYAGARRNYYLALYSHLVARIQLKAAAGVLTSQDIESLNTLLH